MADKRSRVPSSVDLVFDDDDLMSTILLFVPAKLLVSSIKLVSKRWQSLVSDKQFRLMHALHHRRRHNPPTSFIIRANPRCFFYFCPGLEIFRPFEFRFPYSKILQSCHGLLLLETRKTLYGAKNYSVYNPTTAESRDILIMGSISGLCLAFDPAVSPFYKVISIKQRDKKHSLSLYWIEIYDSQTRAWTCLKKPFTSIHDANFFNGIFWNNGIYWIRRDMNGKSYYLDLETGIVGTPKRVVTHKRCNTGSRKNYVMESDGNLHYVSLYSRAMDKMMSLKVSVLLNDLAWFEKHKVMNLSPLFTKFQEAQVAVLCIARLGGDTEEDSAVLFLMWDKIVFYRFCDGYFKDIFHHLPTKEFYKHGRLHYQHNHAYPFIETLVPI
ncbi:F-box protein At5g07610-like [Henckelia pumila]|uniref:F-box protein At5g07610-like n=1 Tax=Henckelia pumila TaxID=405737 RepID=UPI003C6E16D6